MNVQTEMTEAQRQFDNKLLRLIQQHFPSIPLHGEEADKNWTRWLNFARDCAHLTKPDAGGGYPMKNHNPPNYFGATPSPVPAEPSVVPMPAYIYGRECSENERVLPIAAVENYADARVSEAVRRVLEEAAMLFHQPYQEYFGRESQDAIRALIAKYTQTQKESK